MLSKFSFYKPTPFIKREKIFYLVFIEIQIYDPRILALSKSTKFQRARTLYIRPELNFMDTCG